MSFVGGGGAGGGRGGAPAPPRNRAWRIALYWPPVLSTLITTVPPAPTVIGTWTQAPLLKPVMPIVRGPVPSSTVTLAVRPRAFQSTAYRWIVPLYALAKLR